MIEVGEKIELSDEKEYIVADSLTLHNTVYYYLITEKRPIEILIVNEKYDNGELILDEVKDNDELDYVLSQFAFKKN